MEEGWVTVGTWLGRMAYDCPERAGNSGSHDSCRFYHLRARLALGAHSVQPAIVQNPGRIVPSLLEPSWRWEFIGCLVICLTR